MLSVIKRDNLKQSTHVFEERPLEVKSAKLQTVQQTSSNHSSTALAWNTAKPSCSRKISTILAYTNPVRVVGVFVDELDLSKLDLSREKPADIE